MRTIGLGAIIGAFVGFLIPFVLEYRADSVVYIFNPLIFAIVGAGVGILINKWSSFASQPVTRATQTRFTLFLLAGCILSLILGNFLFAIFLGIATLGAWYSLQQMKD